MIHLSQEGKVFVFYTSNDVLCHKSLGNGSVGGGVSIRLMERVIESRQVREITSLISH